MLNHIRCLQLLCIIFIVGLSACGSRSPSELMPSPPTTRSAIASPLPSKTATEPATSPPTTAQVASRSATLTADPFDYDYTPWVPAVEIASLSPEGQIEGLVSLRLQHFENDQATDCYRILDFAIESIDMSEQWTELIDDSSYTAVGLVSFWVRPVQRNCAWPPAGGGKEAVRDGHYIALLSRLYGLHRENEGYRLVDLTQMMT